MVIQTIKRGQEVQLLISNKAENLINFITL